MPGQGRSVNPPVPGDPDEPELCSPPVTQQDHLHQRTANWRHTLHEIIFEADTPAGRWFDVVLLGLILLSCAAVMVESVPEYGARYGAQLRLAEWILTGVFTVEYVLRLVSVRRPLSYAKSFFGVVDLAAVLPTYVSIFVPGAQSLLIIRALRLLRIFRVLKMVRFLGEASQLSTALRASRHKIVIFIGVVLTTDLIVGTLMYLIEGPENGFTSIPRAFYWAVVTMTTVGYGDVTPQTPLGQALAMMLMIIGYGIIAVPTGIVSAELAHVRGEVSTQACPSCSADGHDANAVHCKFCGEAL